MLHRKKKASPASEKRPTESGLRESQKRLSQILQGLTISAFVIDQNHIVTHCNRALENLSGISASELIGTANQWKTFYPIERPI